MFNCLRGDHTPERPNRLGPRRGDRPKSLDWADGNVVRTARASVSRARRPGCRVAVGGGVGAIALFLLSQLLGVDLSGLAAGGTQPADSASVSNLSPCTTGGHANKDVRCRIKGATASLEVFWAEELPACGNLRRGPRVGPPRPKSGRKPNSLSGRPDQGRLQRGAGRTSGRLLRGGCGPGLLPTPATPAECPS